MDKKKYLPSFVNTIVTTTQINTVAANSNNSPFISFKIITEFDGKTPLTTEQALSTGEYPFNIHEKN